MFNNEFWGFLAKLVSGCLQLFLMNIKCLPNQTKLKYSCKAFLLISQHLKHHFDCCTEAQYVAESQSNNLLFWNSWVVRSAPLIPGVYLCRAERVSTRHVTVEIECNDPPVGPNFWEQDLKNLTLRNLKQASLSHCRCCSQSLWDALWDTRLSRVLRSSKSTWSVAYRE